MKHTAGAVRPSLTWVTQRETHVYGKKAISILFIGWYHAPHSKLYY